MVVNFMLVGFSVFFISWIGGLISMENVNLEEKGEQF